jgi:hypothetical protein
MVAANILNKHSREGDKGWSSSLGYDARLIYLTAKTYDITKHFRRPRGEGTALIFIKKR